MDELIKEMTSFIHYVTILVKILSWMGIVFTIFALGTAIDNGMNRGGRR